MTTRQPRVDQTAIASLATAVVGVIAWPFLGGWAALLAATLSLVFGFLVLSRVKRNGHTGRWLAVQPGQGAPSTIARAGSTTPVTGRPPAACAATGHRRDRLGAVLAPRNAAVSVGSPRCTPSPAAANPRASATWCSAPARTRYLRRGSARPASPATCSGSPDESGPSAPTRRHPRNEGDLLPVHVQGAYHRHRDLLGCETSLTPCHVRLMPRGPRPMSSLVVIGSFSPVRSAHRHSGFLVPRAAGC